MAAGSLLKQKVILHLKMGKSFTDSLNQQGKNEPRDRDDAIKRLRSVCIGLSNMGKDTRIQ